jgi:peptidoglycan/xylan/chitin deacetylase (PgdA/CDA1 family)
MGPTVASEPLAEDAAWAALTRELDLWGEAGRTAAFWCRDDDAIAATPALDRLLGLGAEFGVPLGIAVVPGRLSPDLPVRLAGCDSVFVLQHGWRHVNHARGEGAWELGDHRPLEQVEDDLRSGSRRLADAFGGQFLPVLAPPWHRISANVVACLPALGFIGLSTFGARPRREAAPGLVQVNTHCDPIKWKPDARFAGTARSIDDLTSHLQARRTGAADPAEPTGIVIHHLAADPATWAFLAELLRRTAAHPAARWLAAPGLFRS